MKIILFSTPSMDYKGNKLVPIGYDATRECPPYGLYLLGTILSQNKHEVVVADLVAHGTNDISKFKKEITDSSLLGISATTLSWPTAIDVIDQVRQTSPTVPIVLGGVHPSTFPRYILNRFKVDYIISGEAELSLLKLCDALSGACDLSDVPGLIWKKADGSIIMNLKADRLSEKMLSSSPAPDFSLVPANVYKGLSIESSRGCAFNCSFCSASYRKKWVPLDPERFVDNLEEIMVNLNLTKYNIIYIIDDEFSLNTKRCVEIADTIRKKGINPRMTYDSRVGDINPMFLESMKDFTHQILIGAECGYNSGLNKIGKGTSITDIENAAQNLSKYGLAGSTDFSFIVGFPWETRQDIDKTLEYAGYLLAEYGVRILIQWYLQMPASRIWIEFRESEIVHESMYDEYGFFRNLYLFRSGNILKPSEIWELSRVIENIKVLSQLRFPNIKKIDHALPLPIYQYFPENYYDLS
ncbi:MAG: radical SAM protein [Thermodesulfobacteriota bacterium]